MTCRLKSLIFSLVVAPAFLSGCDSGTSTAAREPRELPEMQPAIGKDQEKELARIQKATKSKNAPAGSTPGR